LAALAVFLHHVCFASLGSPPVGHTVGAATERFLFYVCSLGSSGVDLFFVLSGFLITSLLIKDRSNPAYYRDFYWKRVLRILPVYLLCLLLVLRIFPGSGHYVLLCLIFLPNLAYPLHIPAMGPFWSLGIEEQFYLAWPTILHRRSVPQIARWAAWLWIFVVVLRVVVAFWGHYNYFLTPLRVDGLAAGAFLACRNVLQHEKGSSLAADRRYLPALVGLGLVLCVGGLVPTAGPLLAFEAAAYETGVVLLSFALIGSMVAYAGSRRLGAFRSAPLLFFGAISYAFYMTHAYVMEFYDRFAGPLPPERFAPYALRLFSVLAISVGVCLLSRYLIELPAVSLRKYVLRRPTPAPEIAEPLLPESSR
jgi:peptidoglycan/LPS O-acetylase OafA/YrhL